MGTARRDHVEATAVLTAGRPHQLRIEYLQLEFDALLKLQWHSVNGSSRRRAWRGFRRAIGLTPGRAKPFPARRP